MPRHYYTHAKDELDLLRAQLEHAGEKWATSGVLTSSNSEAFALLAEADSMLSKVFEIVASESLRTAKGIHRLVWAPLECEFRPAAVHAVASKEDQQTALAELTAFRARLDVAGRRWTATGVLAADSDEAQSMLAYADVLMGRVFDVIANDGLDERARNEAAWFPAKEIAA